MASPTSDPLRGISGLGPGICILKNTFHIESDVQWGVELFLALYHMSALAALDLRTLISASFLPESQRLMGMSNLDRFLSPTREGIQEQDRCRKAQEVYWKYTLEKKVQAHPEIKLCWGSPNQGYLFLLWVELGDIPLMWFIHLLAPWAGPSISCSFFLIWLLWNCQGVRCMLGVLVITM